MRATLLTFVFVTFTFCSFNANAAGWTLVEAPVDGVARTSLTPIVALNVRYSDDFTFWESGPEPAEERKAEIKIREQEKSQYYSGRVLFDQGLGMLYYEGNANLKRDKTYVVSYSLWNSDGDIKGSFTFTTPSKESPESTPAMGTPRIEASPIIESWNRCCDLGEGICDENGCYGCGERSEVEKISYTLHVPVALPSHPNSHILRVGVREDDRQVLNWSERYLSQGETKIVFEGSDYLYYDGEAAPVEEACFVFEAVSLLSEEIWPLGTQCISYGAGDLPEWETMNACEESSVKDYDYQLEAMSQGCSISTRSSTRAPSLVVTVVLAGLMVLRRRRRSRARP